MILRDLLRVLGSSDRRDGRNLTHEEAYRAFGAVLDGDESEIRIGAFLVAMRWKGVTVEELTGFARAARERATLPCEGMDGLVCVCPPHDGYETTPPLEAAAGIVAAGAGARVLVVCDSHVPPQRGITAADVLEHVRAGWSWDPAKAEASIERTGFAGIAAAGMLPALLTLRRVRGDIGVRTPLSTVEKLLAPPSAACLLGAQHGPVLCIAVETMAGLGHPSGIAVQGVAGGVIPTLRRRSRGIELDVPHQVPLTVEPADFGLTAERDPELPLFSPPLGAEESLEGTGTGDNPLAVRAAADMVESVLAGEPGPARSASVLGAALVLKTGRRVPTLAEGVDAATRSLDSGAAKAVLEKLRARA